MMGWFVLARFLPHRARNISSQTFPISLGYLRLRSSMSIRRLETRSLKRVYASVHDYRHNNNEDALISRTVQPRYCSRNYASKIHLLPALTNFRQTRFPGVRKYLHGSAAVIPASRRFHRSHRPRSISFLCRRKSLQP